MPTVEYPYRDTGWDKQIYPMPSFPMLLVSNLEASSAWYQNVLGFADVFTMRMKDGRPVIVHLRWCMFADLLLTPAGSPTGEDVKAGITLNFATTSADEIAERARSAGARIISEPTDRPWNARDVTIADPDGYRLNFTAPRGDEATRRATFDEIVERVSKAG
jgi:Uncharacterized protein conserved in bacteria